jgi:hypothetical protein
MFDTKNDLPAGKRAKLITVLNARLTAHGTIEAHLHAQR